MGQVPIDQKVIESTHPTGIEEEEFSGNSASRLR